MNFLNSPTRQKQSLHFCEHAVKVHFGSAAGLATLFLILKVWSGAWCGFGGCEGSSTLHTVSRSHFFLTGSCSGRLLECPQVWKIIKNPQDIDCPLTIMDIIIANQRNCRIFFPLIWPHLYSGVACFRWKKDVLTSLLYIRSRLLCSQQVLKARSGICLLYIIVKGVDGTMGCGGHRNLHML